MQDLQRSDRAQSLTVSKTRRHLTTKMEKSVNLSWPRVDASPEDLQFSASAKRPRTLFRGEFLTQPAKLCLQHPKAEDKPTKTGRLLYRLCKSRTTPRDFFVCFFNIIYFSFYFSLLLLLCVWWGGGGGQIKQLKRPFFSFLFSSFLLQIFCSWTRWSRLFSDWSRAWEVDHQAPYGFCGRGATFQWNWEAYSVTQFLSDEGKKSMFL